MWGRVVADEGSVWRLDTGRVAKKATECAKWHWDVCSISDVKDGAKASRLHTTIKHSLMTTRIDSQQTS